MIDNGTGGGLVIGGVSVGAAAKWLWDRFITQGGSPEAKANDQLVEQLSQRIANLEARQTKQEADLDEERRLRRLAEDKVHALQLDNLLLRSELRRHGIEVPPNTVLPAEPSPAAPVES
jgi:1,6-anhydro-N-acetylmuramate kinase